MCVEIRSDAGHLLVIDCGSGARGLGQAILREPNPPTRINILLTHTHWDHIQGFPFFGPAFASGFDVHIYGPSGSSRSIEQSLAGQMDPTYFPVSLKHLASIVRFEDIGETTLEIGDFIITSRHLNHTAPTLGYRISCNGRTIVYATDHEPPDRFWHSWPGHRWQPEWEGQTDLDRLSGHIDLARDADLLLHDAQYVDEEYPAHRGWGHSTVEYACQVAAQAGVKRLVLFHHDPSHNDRFIDQALERARSILRELGADIEVSAAIEGNQEILGDPKVSGVDLPGHGRIAPIDDIELLRPVGLFERLDAPDLRSMLELAVERTAAAGEVLVEQGEIPAGVSVIVDGIVEARAHVPLLGESLDLPLMVLGGRSCFGELSVIDQIPSPATYTAICPVRLLEISRAAFLGLLEDRPHLALRLFAVMARELKRQDDLVRRVLIDPATGAFTRLALEEYFRREVHRVQRRGGYLTLLSVSLPAGEVGSNHHEAADENALLSKVAHALRIAVRHTDLIVRYDWHELVALLVDTDPEGGRAAAERVERILRHLPDVPSDQHWRIGISSQQGGGVPLDVLVAQARQAHVP